MNRIAMAVLAAATMCACAGAAERPDFGGAREDFTIGVASNKAFAILPRGPAPSGPRPWIWYAPTFLRANAGGGYPNANQHAWLFAQLLSNGFAIAGVDVGESFGSPAGRAVYTEFHAAVTGRFGLAARACLLPQSRGGLMLYAWAAEHPELVQCIGGVYPVGDLTSYPGLDRACGAYGLDEAGLRERLKEHNPVERLAPLAKAGVPILHLHGDVDRVVPIERNSGALAERYRALGGAMEVVVIPGHGHDSSPEFFRNPKLVGFFVRQAMPRAATAPR